MKKRHLIFAVAIAASTVFQACKKEGCTDSTATNYDEKAKEDDGSCIYDNPGGGTETVSSNITSNTTWSADKTYILSGRIAVEDGATLTIEAGTLIKAKGGTEANASVLIIARGGKIMAQGTAASPIIFTSETDQIKAGEIESPNLDESDKGLWGGVIILGKAPISADASEVQIEGIPVSDANGLYGGSVSADNSGVFSYVSIRHGGTSIGSGNEINGLTLGGVGSGTTIDHVEVVANVDDGIEFFGGTVDASDLLVWAQGDDAFDVDQAWSGTVDGFMYIGDAESDHALEIDGPEGSGTGSFTLTNGTLIGYNDAGACGDGGEYADFRDGATGTVSNVYAENFCVDADWELDGGDNDSVLVVSQNYTAGSLVFSSIEIKTSHLSSGNTAITDIFLDKSYLDAFTTDPADATIVTTATVGATSSEFENWTWAHAAGAF